LLNKKTKEELNETHDLTQKLISELRVLVLWVLGDAGFVMNTRVV
jgi:hypothetical protein